MPEIHHNSSLSENSAVFCFSVLSLRQKRDYIRSSIQLSGYILLFVSMATAMLKVAVSSASVLLFASIGLLVWNLLRETANLRTVQAQIMRLCATTQYKDIVNHEDSE
jgi:hypothetical protein